MATGLYNGVRPLPNAKVSVFSENVVAFMSKGRTEVTPVLGYGETPSPSSFAFMPKASNPTPADRVLTCKQLPDAVIENSPALFPRGYGMAPTQGYARGQKPGLAYVRPLDAPILKEPNSQYALLDAPFPTMD